MVSNNDLTDSENILVKVDQNNLIYIDPNSVVDGNGDIQPRGFKQENLVMYVNLEADLIPRSSLIALENQGNTLQSIAKGNLNFLKSQTGDGNLDTSWTETYVPPQPKDGNGDPLPFNPSQFKDESGQSFGITSISIVVKSANFIPQITINFVDVRGKTLFEDAANSPYKAFFHLPWPIFYLTVKGYYGKAIRYRLHMTKFSGRFNESNGNFEVVTTFVGSTFAFLNDILLSEIINCPYMFLVEKSKKETFNQKTGKYEKIIARSSRGYQILSSVYSQYKQKGLIPQDFPVKTLKELGYIAESLDKVLEETILNEVVDPKIFQGIKDVDDVLYNFSASVKAWVKKNVDITIPETYPPGTTSDAYWYYLKGKKENINIITGSTVNGTLEMIITTYTEGLKKAVSFVNDLKIDELKVKSGFQKIALKNVGNVSSYYRIFKDGKIIVGADNLIREINKIGELFNEQRKKVEDGVEKKMNEIVKDKKRGFGFEPTVRNIFAVLLANAEVYIRLMKDVHDRAFNISKERVKVLTNLTNESKSSPIYPWPEIKKPISGGKYNVIAYPGEEGLLNKLKSYDRTLWPEVEFIEEYIKIATNRLDTNVDNEPTISDIQYLFEQDSELNSVEDLWGVDVISDVIPYTDKTYASFVYEIYERAKYLTLLDSFSNDFVKNLANEEFKNIKVLISEDLDLIDFAKKLTSRNSLINVTYNRISKGEGTAENSPITGTTFGGYLPGLSPFERFNYMKDDIPTIDYIKDSLNEPFKFEKYGEKRGNEGDIEQKVLDSLNTDLKNYVPESYRTKIYPFNSSTYLGYLDGKSSFSEDYLKFQGILKIDTKEGFICSPINSKSWVKSGYVSNLFGKSITNGTTTVNILNTPYFHKQLDSDFSNTSKFGKYVGSSYLLLNSLPFLELEDEITFNVTSVAGIETSKTILMSSLFREVSATHFIPYHLMLKWGSIYHRYKNYIINGVDILDGFLDVTNITEPIDGNAFFDNNLSTVFTIIPKVNTTTGPTINVEYSGHTNVGLNPFYHAIYHQIVNDYATYDVLYGNTTYYPAIQSNQIIHRKFTPSNNINYWTVFTDNSQYVSTDLTYTLLPSNGFIDESCLLSSDTYYFAEQSNFRTIWFYNETIYDEFSGKAFASPSEYTRSLNTDTTYDDIFSVDTNFRKVIDLIGTFSPKILDSFEEMFLDFASEKTNDEIPYEIFAGLTYSKFQDVLKGLSVVEKKSSDDSDINSLIKKLIVRQENNAKLITEAILSNDNLIKFSLANPKEIDPYTFYGMSKFNGLSMYNVDPFYINDMTPENLGYIKLYIGEDIDSYYINFFSVNDIKLTEDSIKEYRPLALIYGGYVASGGVQTKTAFGEYLKNNIITTSDKRLALFLDILLPLISKYGNITETKGPSIIERQGYNNDDVKLEMYNTFKSFNDKWTAGNSIGQRSLLEEFLFIDRANRDIGSKFYLNISRILPLLDIKNIKQNLYGAISLLIGGKPESGLDMRALPAYVNFYGTNVNNKTKIVPSKRVAKNLFGTFMEVDTEESSPKILIQLVGATSKRLDNNNKDFNFRDDSFYIGAVNNNPLVITSMESFSKKDFSKTNKVVAFEVSIGDQYQGIFKSVQLDQSSLKNTSESFVVLENIGRSASGAGVYNVDVGLFDYYKSASYTCTVTCMGNVMIQPTMFFYIKNIPMFRGTYWILEVSHTIKGNNIETTFTGTRIPYSSLPDPEDSFASSYRVLFERIASKAYARLKQEENPLPKTEEKIIFENKSYVIDKGDVKIQGEITTTEQPTVGITEFGVPYNGYNGEKLIQKVDNNLQNGTWLRAVVVRMDGPNYPIATGTTMGIADGITWASIKDSKYMFYGTKFQLSRSTTKEKIRTAITEFYNPNPKGGKKTYTLTPNYQLTGNTIIANGPVNVGPLSDKYGMCMSTSLMSALGLYDGQVVYFRMI